MHNLGHFNAEKGERGFGYTWTLLFLLYFIGVWGVGCTSGNPADKALDARLARQFAVWVPEKQTIARDFQLENLSGETISLRDYRGKLFLLNFSTSW